MVIKEALLDLLAKKDYSDITITDICRTSEINRGTFYLHYTNSWEVLDALFDDAMNQMRSVWVQIGCASACEAKKTSSLCMFLRENKKYQPLFFSDSLHSYVIDRLAAFAWEDYCRQFSDQNGLSEDIMKSIFYFQLNGCLAVSKQNIEIPDNQWTEIQCHIDRFIKNGLVNL
jgi:hypothetical protein